MKKIISIGLIVPSEEIERIDYDQKVSLLDYDIILVNPEIPYSYLAASGEFNGKDSLTDQKSFKFREDLAHLKREIEGALKVGKTVVFYLKADQSVYAATGEMSYSGSGRNRLSQRVVNALSSYSILPSSLKTTNTNGKYMKLHAKAALLKDYWKNFEQYSTYEVIIESKDVDVLIQTKTGEKTVGAVASMAGYKGALLLLPFIDISRDEFYYEEEDLSPKDEPGEAEDEQENVDGLTDLGRRVGKTFLHTILEIDKALHAANHTTPAPDWVTADRYMVGREQELNAQLVQIESQIAVLQVEKSEIEGSLIEEQGLKDLLYGTDKALELAVLKALTIMGFTAQNFADGTYEFDILFEAAEGRLLGEVEGKDSKPINVDKIRQLAMNVQEEFAKSGNDNMAKGVLFGNAHRLTTPDARKEWFTDRCVTGARGSNLALVSTVDLFWVARYLLSSQDEQYASQCRATLVNSVGILSFPPIPNP